MALHNMNQPDLLASFPRQAFVTAGNEDDEAIATVALAIGLLDLGHADNRRTVAKLWQ